MAYFRSLVPTLGTDPRRFGPEMRRRAFTLAAATDKVLVAKVQQTILDLLKSGKPTNGPKAVQAVLDAAGVAPRSKGYGELVFRTNVLDAYNTAADEERMAPDVVATFPAWRYAGIRDGREGDDHRPHFDKYYPASVPFAKVRGDRIFNCRCVLPGAMIQGRVVAALQAWYSGEAVELVTRTGSRLSVTPNHPVLTEHGFVAAGSLKEGDYLIGYRPSADASQVLSPNNKQNAPTLIEKVFGALQRAGSLVRAERLSSLDFHGDGAFVQGDVYVATVHGSLRSDQNPTLAEFLDQREFSGHSKGLGSLVADCSAGSGLRAGRIGHETLACGLVERPHYHRLDLRLAAQGNSGLPKTGLDSASSKTESSGQVFHVPAGEVQPFEFGGVNVATEYRFGSGSLLDARLAKPAGESRSGDASFLSELRERFPASVATDQVLQVCRFHYDGPVYDLQTSLGYYTAAHAEGVARIAIILSNCTAIPVSKGQWRRLKAGGGKIADGYPDVPADAPVRRVERPTPPAPVVEVPAVDAAPVAALPEPAAAIQLPEPTVTQPVRTWGAGEIGRAIAGNQPGQALAARAAALHRREAQAAVGLDTAGAELRSIYQEIGRPGAVLTPQERTDYLRRVAQAEAAGAAALAELRQARQQALQQAHALLAAPNPAAITAEPKLFPPERTETIARDGAAFVGRLLSAKVRPSLSVPTYPTPAGRRSYERNGTITLSADAEPRTAVHELGHVLEGAIPGAREAARAFLEHRVGKEAALKLVDRWPGYEPDEMGRKDHFDRFFDEDRAYYVGKIYDTGETEVLSMGMEALYTDPAGFAAKDPEYFKFMVGILDGSLLRGRP